MHMHGHDHEVPSGRRAGSRAMHARDTHRLTGRSITRSVVALGGPGGARKDADVAAKQRQAASASREHRRVVWLSPRRVMQPFVRSRAHGPDPRNRTRSGRALTVAAGARHTGHGTRRRARQPLECARPCGERERIGVGGGLVGRAPLSRAHAGGRAPREGGGTWSPRASPLRQFGLSRSRRRSYGNGTHYRCRCLMPCIGVCTQCTRPAAEPTATLHAS